MNTLLSTPNQGVKTLRDEPPVRRGRRVGWRRAVPIALTLALVAGGGYEVQKVRAMASRNDGLQYRVANVMQGTVRRTVSTTGTLEPWSTVSIKSKAGGRVDVLLVDVGSVVRKNQVIARIDPTDTQASVQNAQASLTGALAHTKQAEVTYQLQQQQSGNAVQSAQTALRAAQAAQIVAQVQLATAQSAARAQPGQTAAVVAQAQANYDEAVRNRQALDATNPQDRASAQATFDQATANQKAAQVALDRQAALADKGYVAQQTVDTAQASLAVYGSQAESAQEKLNTLASQQQSAVAAADARVAAAKASLQNARTGAVDITAKQNAVRQATAALNQINAQVASAQLALRLAQDNLANATIKGYDVTYQQSQITANQATLKSAKETLSQTVVRAPADGVVTAKDVSEGTYITSGISQNSTGTSIVEIADLSRMYVQATVDETDVARVHTGQKVDVHFDAYPELAFTGKVSRVEPLAVVNSNVTQFNIRVEIANNTPDYKKLMPGMNATCDFVVSEKANVLSVPTSAIQKTGPDSGTVQVVSGGHPAQPDAATGLLPDPNTLVGAKVHRVPVTLGLTGSTTTEVTGGLSANDRVVLQIITPTAPDSASSQNQQKSAFGNMGGPGGPPPGGGGPGGGGRSSGGGGKR